MAYNAYNAIKNITDNKANYDTAKATGQDFEKFRNDAKVYYDELRSNGYGDIADQLSKSNTSQAMKLLDQFSQNQEKESPKYNVGNEKTDNYINDLLGIASGKNQFTPSAATQGVIDSFQRNDELLRGLNTDFYNTGKNQLDYINNFDYTKQPYYDSIMSSYKMGGEDAANGEYAGGAASNGGNIDSYATANANRQQLAFTNAGHEAARAAAQQNQSNWQALYETMGGHLTDMGAINSANLGYGANMYANDAATAQNAQNALTNYFMNESNNATAIEQQKLTNQINEALANIQAATDRYGYDSSERQNALNAETNKLISQIQSDASIKTAQISADASKYSADASANASKYNADMDVQKALLSLYTSGDDESGDETTDDEPIDLTMEGVVKTLTSDGGFPSGVKNYNELISYLVNEDIPIEIAESVVEHLQKYNSKYITEQFRNNLQTDVNTFLGMISDKWFKSTDSEK